ncbi:hypothetical protein BASA61_010491 [Batrachochytrium salamandrivorans]|nr:hypothetical protein BASA61_010491 [Batrachochytrium salamandrivorans]
MSDAPATSSVHATVSQSLLELQRRLQQASMPLISSDRQHVLGHSNTNLLPHQLPRASRKDLDLLSQDTFPALPLSSPVSTANRPVWRPAAVAVSDHITEHFDIPPQLQLKQQLGKQSSSYEVCKAIMRRTGTSIELSTNQKTGTLTVLITGSPKAVNQSRREVLHGLCAQVTQQLSVPASVRSSIVGKGGNVLKSITTRTLTEINISRTDKPKDPNAPDVDPSTIDPEAEQIISIIGDPEGVAMAQKEIEAIVATRTSTHTSRVKIERSFHQFIAGPGGCAVATLQEQYGIKIHIAPPDVVSSQNNDINDIILVGERSSVLLVLAKINQQYEELQRTTRSISVPIKKKQHRFILGHKGSTLQEIFTTTSCIVDVPSASSDDECVLVRGPENMLTVALQLVLEKANSVLMEEVLVATYLPSTLDANFMIQFLSKDRSYLKSIESEHTATISTSMAVSDKPATIDIQAKTKEGLAAAKNAVMALLKEKGRSLYLSSFDIPTLFHGYIIGKGGQNITKIIAKPQWNGRLVNIMMPDEGSESDVVVLAIKRDAAIAALAPSDMEATALFELIKKDIVDTATASADMVVRTVKVDHKFHGRLIGAGGAACRELIAPYNGAVSIKFPALDRPDSTTAAKPVNNGKSKEAIPDASAIVIKGPKNDVAQVVQAIEKLVADMRHIEVVASFQETLVVPKTHMSLLIGSGLGVTVRTIRERYANKQFKLLPTEVAFEKDLAANTGHLYLTTDTVSSTNGNDVLTITGPKSFVLAAKDILADRLQKLLDSAELQLNVFEEISAEARQVIADMGPELKVTALRRLIGKEGKNLKRLSELHGVFIRISKNRQGDLDEDETEAEDTQPLGMIKIEGGKATIKEAKLDILNFIQNEILRSFRLVLTFPRSALPHVVGRGGSRLAKLKEDLDARVDLNDDYDADLVECVIVGLQSECTVLKSRIESAIDKLINIGTVWVAIPSYLHRHIIGPSGSTIRNLIDATGGADQVKVNFPKQGDGTDENMVTVTAHSTAVDQVVDQLKQLVVQVVSTGGNGQADLTKAEASRFTELHTLDNAVVVEKLLVPKSDISYVLGRNRDDLLGLMRKHGVTLWVVDDGASGLQIHIAGGAGTEKQVHQCLLDMQSKLCVSAIVPIPSDILEVLVLTGPEQTQMLEVLNEHLRAVRSEHNVTIELTGGASKGVQGGAITMRGSQHKMEGASKSLESILKDLQLNKHLVRMSVSSSYRPHIIGRGGQTLKRIRDETGALLDFVSQRHHRGDTANSNTNSSETLTIRGATLSAVTAAKAIVDTLIAEQAERSKRDAERQALRQVQNAAAAAATASNTADGNAGSSDRNHPSSAARIDDDLPSYGNRQGGSMGVSGYVPPGFSGRSSMSQNAGGGGPRVAASVKLSSAISGAEFTATQHQLHLQARQFSFGSNASTAHSTTGWQSVPKKGSSRSTGTGGSDAADSSTTGSVPSSVTASASKKKKNKNKKSKAMDTTTTSEDISVAEVPIALPSSPAATEAKASPVAKELASVSSAPKASKSKATKDATAHTLPSAVAPVAVAAPAAAPVAVAAVAAAPLPRRAATPELVEMEDDGWQTVATKRNAKVGGVATLPTQDSATTVVGAAKKKKNKKKKKAASTSADVSGDVELDE